jgi:hypothetical protein
MTQDEDHLRLLSIFHYVVGGLAGLFSLIPIVHVVLGLLFIAAPEKFAGNGQPPPAFLGWIFVLLGVMFIVLGLVVAGCVVAAGRFLAQRKHYTFCLVTAGVECLFMPFGTVLGVFTIIVLMRDSVKQLFRGATPMQGSGAPPGL